MEKITTGGDKARNTQKKEKYWVYSIGLLCTLYAHKQQLTIN